MGVVVHENTDTGAVDVFALVISGTVVNTVEATGLEAVAAEADYDYLVDVTFSGQTADIGYTYDPVADTFTPPYIPPPNWIAIVQNDFDNIVSELGACLSDASNLNPTDLATAYGNAVSDSSSLYTANEAALMLAIYNFIAGGG